MQRADVTIAGETAGNIPIQIIGDPQFLNDVPGDCGDGNPANNENSFQTLGTNGILGIGLFIEDCGTACAPPNPPVPGLITRALPEEQELARGICKMRPACRWQTRCQTRLPFLRRITMAPSSSCRRWLPAEQASVTGSLVFGIGTQANNGLGSATVLTAVTDRSRLHVPVARARLPRSLAARRFPTASSIAARTVSTSWTAATIASLCGRQSAADLPAKRRIQQRCFDHQLLLRHSQLVGHERGNQRQQHGGSHRRGERRDAVPEPTTKYSTMLPDPTPAASTGECLFSMGGMFIRQSRG